jgi:hypothetical protein
VDLVITERAECDGVVREVRASGNEEDPLWYRFWGEVVPRSVTAGDFAALAVLPWAMAHGEPVRIHHRVHRSLLENLDEYQDVWSTWLPDRLCRVEVVADEEVADPGERSRDALAAFSGGVDSTFVVARHRLGLLGRRNRDLAAAVMIRGFDLPESQRGAFEVALGHARPILGQFGVPLAVVATNWRDKYCFDWSMSFGIGLAAVLHQFVGVAGAGVFADFSYGDAELPWGSNPVTDPMMSSGAFRMESFGAAGVSRMERCAFIAQWPVVRNHVRVCWEDPTLGANCGRCEKCIRTKLNFLAAGYPEIPALRPRVTATEVERFHAYGPLSVRYLEEVASHAGADRLPVAIRRALDATIERENRRFRSNESAPETDALEAERDLLARRCASLERENEDLRTEIQLIHESRSWRLTQPYRAAGDRARQILGRNTTR